LQRYLILISWWRCILAGWRSGSALGETRLSQEARVQTGLPESEVGTNQESPAKAKEYKSITFKSYKV